MATTETSSIHGQSTRTRGVLNPLASRGVIYSFLSGISGDADAISEAVDAMPSTMTIKGLVVPLAAVTSRRTRADAAMVVGQYQFQAGGATAENPFAFARVRVATEYEASWTRNVDGVETINEEYDPELKKVVIRQWQRPYTVWYIDITVTLESPIIDLIAAFHDTVNQNVFTIGGKAFEPLSLHFFAPEQDSVLMVGETGQHRTTYRFRYRGDGGWFRYKLASDNTIEAPELIYPAVGWLDFPTN